MLAKQIISGFAIASVVIMLVAIGICVLPTMLKGALGCGEEKRCFYADILSYALVIVVGFLIYICGYKVATASYAISVVIIGCLALLWESRCNKNNALHVS